MTFAQIEKHFYKKLILHNDIILHYFLTTSTCIKMQNLLQVVNRCEQCCYQLWKMLCCTQWKMLSTRLFSHHKTMLLQHCMFNHQYCYNHGYNLLTRLSNNDNINNMNKLVISILFSPVSITVVMLHASMLNNIVERIVNNIVHSTTLFSHDNWVVMALFNHATMPKQLVLLLSVYSRLVIQVQILYLNCKLSNQKASFVPCDQSIYLRITHYWYMVFKLVYHARVYSAHLWFYSVISLIIIITW